MVEKRYIFKSPSKKMTFAGRKLKVKPTIIKYSGILFFVIQVFVHLLVGNQNIFCNHYLQSVKSMSNTLLSKLFDWNGCTIEIESQQQKVNFTKKSRASFFFVSALIETNEYRFTGRNMFVALSTAGLAEGAKIETEITWKRQAYVANGLYFLLLSNDQLIHYLSTGVTSESYYSQACNAPSSMRWQPATYNTNMQVYNNDYLSTSNAGIISIPAGTVQRYNYTVKFTDQYTLLIVQCADTYRAVANTTIFDFSVTTSAVNPGDNYLPIEDIPLPRIYFILMCGTALILCLWKMEMIINRQHISSLHTMIAIPLMIRVIAMLVNSIYYLKLNEYGKVDLMTAIGNVFLSKFVMMLQLLLLFLVGLGWKVTRADITAREKRLIVLSFGFYFLFILLASSCGDDQENCAPYELAEYVVHSLLLLAVIVAINFNLTHLRSSLNEYSWSFMAPLYYRNLKQYQLFRWLFLAFLLLPTFILLIELLILGWEYSWLTIFTSEVSYLSIYLILAVQFLPSNLNLYTKPFAPEPGAEESSNNNIN